MGTTKSGRVTTVLKRTPLEPGIRIDLLIVADLPERPLEQSEVLYRYVRGREEPKGLRVEAFGKFMAAGKLEYLKEAREL